MNKFNVNLGEKESEYFKILGKEIKIRVAKVKTDKFPGDSSSMLHYKHRVAVTNIKTGVTKYFYFYDSYANYMRDVAKLNVFDFLYTIFNDALASMNCYEDFIMGFGYKDDKQARKIYKEVQKNYEKLKEVFEVRDSKIIRFLNHLSKLELDDLESNKGDDKK